MVVIWALGGGDFTRFGMLHGLVYRAVGLWHSREQEMGCGSGT